MRVKETSDFVDDMESHARTRLNIGEVGRTSVRRGLRTTALPKATARYPIADTPLRVSPICLGRVDDPAVVCEAFDAGVNFFFVTADMHWPVYDGLRRGLEMLFDRGPWVRDEVVVAAVSYVTQAEFCFAPFRETLKAVRKLCYLDMTIVGGSYANDFVVRLHEYTKHRGGGISGVQAVGASFHDRAAALTAVNHGLVDVGFIRYNALHSGADTDMFPHLKGANRSTALLYSFTSTSAFVGADVCRELEIDDGGWLPTVADHYRYVLSRAELDGLLVAPTTKVHLRRLVEALEAGPLTGDERRHMAALAKTRQERAAQR
jgi:hypothetical protein